MSEQITTQQRDFLVTTAVLSLFTSGVIPIEALYAEFPPEILTEKMEGMTHIVTDLEKQFGDVDDVDAHFAAVGIELLKEIFDRV